MSTQNPTEPASDKYAAYLDSDKRSADRYAAYLIGLVELTNLFSEHPEAVPKHGGLNILRICEDRADLVKTARDIGGEWDDVSSLERFKLVKQVGPHEYALYATRHMSPQVGAGLLDDLVGATSTPPVAGGVVS